MAEMVLRSGEEEEEREGEGGEQWEGEEGGGKVGTGGEERGYEIDQGRKRKVEDERSAVEPANAREVRE